MSSDPRPVVALDVDDVLNADAFTEEHVLHIPAASQPRSPFVRGEGLADLTLTVRIDPTLGPWISALRDRADVVWATTWEGMANTHLAPVLGIDPLPVAVSVTEHPPRFGYVKNGDSIGWKASVLHDAFPGRPLVWVDDGAWAYATEAWNVPEGHTWVDWRHPWPDPTSRWAGMLDDDDLDDELGPVELRRAPSLVVAPQRSTGLTLELRALVDAFVDDPFGFVPVAPNW